MFWEMKELSDPRTSLYAVCMKCDELIDKYTHVGERRATYFENPQNLYFKLLDYFLPEYDKMSAYNAKIQQLIEFTYEEFQIWNYIVGFDNQMRLAENNRPPQMRETGVSDMRNLLARLQNT